MNEHETIADVIAEMRGIRVREFQEYADRFEAAHKRERGDCAKLREAVGYILKYADSVACRDHDEHTRHYIDQIRKWAQSALAAPPRNCDVGDAADWEKRFSEECDKGHICSDCPVRYAKTRMAIELDKGARCEFVWAQMPYEAEKGGAK